jgi:hypothetical protein
MASSSELPESLASFAHSSAVQHELRRQYRALKLSSQKEETRQEWQREPTGLLKDYWEPHERARVVADQLPPSHMLPYSIAQSMRNKLTCLYWSWDAQYVYSSGERIFDNGPCAVAWTEWHRHDDLSRLDMGFYFAKCFRMRKCAVTSITGLLSLHREVCNYAEEAVQRSKDQLAKEETPDLELCEEVENAKIRPICRAVIVVLDQRVPEHQAERIKPQQEKGSSHIQRHRRISHRYRTSFWCVRVVRQT